MMRNVIFAALLLCGTATAAQSPTILTPTGIPPITIGMTIRQAEEALGEKLKVDYTESDTEACGRADSPSLNARGVLLMVEDRRVTRIDVDGKQIETAAGVGISSTEAAVKRAYGKRLTIEPHAYDDNGHYLIVTDPDGKHGIVFETDGKRVTTFRAGEFPSVRYIEGCL